ncbi:MAG: hypothetical protein Q7S82_01540 [bacterium]|nr:hypothetical protein [bacterium]
MYNWSTDISKMKSGEEKTIWKLEQMINFGLGKTKISRNLLKRYWFKLKLDPDRRKFLAFLLWNKKNY